MGATEWEKQLYGTKVEIAERGDDSTVYRLSDEQGEIVMTSYPVFPGIKLIYNDVHAPRCAIDVEQPMGDIVEIEHCCEGRVECQMGDTFFYLTPGDISVHRKDDTGRVTVFPLSHYHGVTIMMDLNIVPPCLACLLEDVNVQPAQLVQRLCGETNFFILRRMDRLEHVFSELYSVPAEFKRGYFKVKVLEVLLFLSGVEPQANALRQVHYTASQVALAKQVRSYLLEHIERHITVTQLSERFHASPTQIKTSFRGVFGVSVYADIRTQKMQAAALRLRETDETILEIAGAFGYENGSKFAKAFCTVMGMTPKEYRQAGGPKVREFDRACTTV